MSQTVGTEETLDSGSNDKLCCNKCGKWFTNSNILNIHLQMHTIGKYSKPTNDITIERDVLYEEVRKQQGDASFKKIPVAIMKPRRIYKPPSKRVGLTKIRMEDCLRCDACSCIYMDEKDYYKHMRNFHEKYNTMIPRTRRKSPTGIKYFTNYSSPSDEATPHLKGGQNDQQTGWKCENIQENIKDRWSKVLSHRLSDLHRIKTEIEDPLDISPLLKVEVKIKTEPGDDISGV